MTLAELKEFVNAAETFGFRDDQVKVEFSSPLADMEISSSSFYTVNCKPVIRIDLTRKVEAYV